MSILWLSLWGCAPALVGDTAAVDAKAEDPEDAQSCAYDGNDDGDIDVEERMDAVPDARCMSNGGFTVGGVLAPTFVADGWKPTIYKVKRIKVPKVVIDKVTASGIPGRKYVDDVYDCDDFARDTTTWLDQTYGSDVGTYTIEGCGNLDANGKFNPKLTELHSTSDIHLWIDGEPVVGWVDATGVPEGGASAHGWGGYYDGDHDGSVNVTNEWPPGGGAPTVPTETNAAGTWGCFIFVADSYAAAVAAGAPTE